MPMVTLATHLICTLTQNATVPIVMLGLEAGNIHRDDMERTLQNDDHNLLQADFKIADET